MALGSFYKTHAITGAVDGYQIRIVVHYGAGSDSGENVYLNSKCQTDFSDIRFTDDSGAYLDFWIDARTNSDNAICWVKLNAAGSVTIRIYYGCSQTGAIFKIGGISDGHNDTSNCSNLSATECVDFIDDFVTRMNAVFVPDLVFCTGDMEDCNTGRAEATVLGFLEESLTAFSACDAEQIFCPGNHEFQEISFVGARDKILEFYNFYEPNVLYGSKDVGAFHVIVLDDSYDVTDTHLSENDPDNNYVGATQMVWLTSDLAATDKPTIVFAHRDLGRRSTTDHWHNNTSAYPFTDDRNAVKDILEASGKVICVIQGHIHDSATVYRHGIPYIYCPSLTAYNESTTTDNMYDRVKRTLSGSAASDGQWLEITINTWRKEIKIDTYEDYASEYGGGLVTHTHYLYYNFNDIYGKASNPYYTFSANWGAGANEMPEFTGPDNGDMYGLNQNSVGIHCFQADLSIIPTTPQNITACRIWSKPANDTETPAWVVWCFSCRTGNFRVLFRILFEETNKDHDLSLQNSTYLFGGAPHASYTGPRIKWGSDGTIKYHTGAAWVAIHSSPVGYAVDTWYQVELHVSQTTTTYEIYIDNVQVNESSLSFYGAPENLNSLQWYKDSGDTYYEVSFYISDLRVQEWVG